MKTGLVIVTKDRPQYLRRCLDSLEKADLEGVHVLIIDAGSTDEETISMIYDARQKWHDPARTASINVKRFGFPMDIKAALHHGFSTLIHSFECDFLINLDGDAIVTPDFVRRLEVIYQELPMAVLSGFGKEGIPSGCAGKWYRKDHVNGINMAFGVNTYRSTILPALEAGGNWDYNVGPGLITNPSCVQHIGYKSSMGHNGDVDLAIDFPPQLHLPDVTLFGIDSHDKYGIQKAARLSQLDISFGAVKIITDDLFTPNGTREQRREDYSRFCIRELTNHFDTSHVLIIHADGWVVNPLAWTDEFLQYDYIGAPWWYNDGLNVGNGGFSLRSKRLCDFLSTAGMEHIHPEDHHICRTYRRSIEQAGFRFAPEELAERFSVEGRKYNQQFGFHGMACDFTGADIARVPYRPVLQDPINMAWEARKKRSDRWKV